MSHALLEKIKSFAEKFYPIQMRQLIVEIDLELQKPDPVATLKDIDEVLANMIVPDPVEIAWCRAKIAKALNEPS